MRDKTQWPPAVRPRKSYIIIEHPGVDHVELWIDSDLILKVSAIEGVAFVRDTNMSNKFYITLDPRYNKEDVYTQIRVIAFEKEHYPGGNPFNKKDGDNHG